MCAVQEIMKHVYAKLIIHEEIKHIQQNLPVFTDVKFLLV